MSDALVRFGEGGPAVRVPVGTAVRDAAADAGITLDAPCGGLGRCGRCRVRASGALEPPDATERALLTAEELSSGVRLACRARIAGDADVLPPEHAGLRAVDFGVTGEIEVDSAEARGLPGTGPAAGLAVDVGTTTIACTLVDLRTGAVLGGETALNPQVAEGHDVMSRVSAALEGRADAMQSAVAGTIERLASELSANAGLPTGAVLEMAVAGNTTMLSLLIHRDVSPLAAAPYEGAFVATAHLAAAELGMEALPRCGVRTMPGVSAFIGADVVAGALATGIAQRDETALLIDLGTNGEILLSTPAGMLATSTAAGPALEGATISTGMRAEAGAIERVELARGDLALTVIAEEPPRGLCGSGLLDLIAVLLDAGAIDSSGQLAAGSSGPIGDRLVETDGGRAVRVTSGVLLTQADVRQVQLAKGAVRAGLDLLLAEAGIAADEVERVLIAGGFGYHVRPAALVRMGLLPAAWEERVVFVGNASLAGALRALLGRRARDKAEDIARTVGAIDLAAKPGFQERFIARLALERDPG